jgi:methyltransferase (TIGR00027 family)
MTSDESQGSPPPANLTSSESRPSQTALTAAAARAAHLIVDDPPVIFADTLAMILLADKAETFVGYHRAHGEHPVLSSARAQVACRSRYTEERLAAAVESGITQYVLLGAGLDTFAYRSALAGRVRVFEVDHPATQRWKRDQLAAAAIDLPACLTFVPVDLEHGLLRSELVRAGFDPASPAFVSWLGVTMYLTESAIAGTLGEIGGLAPGTQIVADYMLPATLRDEAGVLKNSQMFHHRPAGHRRRGHLAPERFAPADQAVDDRARDGAATAVNQADKGHIRPARHIRLSSVRLSIALDSTLMLLPVYGQRPLTTVGDGCLRWSCDHRPRCGHSRLSAARQHLARICAGELPPGRALPSETSLMQEHGIARETGRKAVRVLRDEGLVVVVRGRGAFVKPLS